MVHLDDPAAALRTALEPDPDPAPELLDGARLAAVLAPLILGPEPSLLFTIRAAALSRHAGEVSFPGGLVDAGETLRAAALREAQEEIGLDADAVELVGALPAVHTFVSGILVVPFVGILRELPALRVSSAEIDEVLTFPVAELARSERVVSYDRPGGRTWRGYAYEMDGATVWGATGWMLHMLLDTIRKETSWPMP